MGKTLEITTNFPANFCRGRSQGVFEGYVVFIYIYITTWRKIILSFYFTLYNIFDISMTCDMSGVMERRLDQRSRSNR